MKEFHKAELSLLIENEMQLIRVLRETRIRASIVNAFLNGVKIESRFPGESWKRDKKPVWDWSNLQYRIK